MCSSESDETKKKKKKNGDQVFNYVLLFCLAVDSQPFLDKFGWISWFSISLQNNYIPPAENYPRTAYNRLAS